MTREGHKADSECGQWKVTSDFLMATNTNVCPLAVLPDFFQNMAYKIGDKYIINFPFWSLELYIDAIKKGHS